MLLSLFAHFNRRLRSIRRDLQELRTEKVRRVSQGVGGLVTAIIASLQTS